ncbi:T9SS type A sorting domain-containing protein [Spirosoma montaniterrae]|uniref:Secretion system C-terminal sorting domain-containing protein n=1 Tax=Spirosoma montaniterrae TaxID=1178516 RepID=A0A1P9X1K1_9BACT|nr:T9SS type A sorting domain-containing protein [Spirosoma montaniterrae]AQG81522.1 hypothetical protein AWR27_20720 [Spirosoma montaniterrae]
MRSWKPLARLLVLILLIDGGSGRLLRAQSAQHQATVSPPGGYRQFVRQMRTERPGNQITCFRTDQSELARVLPPDAFRQGRRDGSGRLAAPTAQISVNYTNFPAEARRAFQYAVDIWATLISSPVPIRIQANWALQEPGELGSAGPTSYIIGPDGAQKAYGYYAIALAEKIARRQLNDPNAPDIIANINRNVTWYYGIDGKTPADRTDLVTAVLHELTHGFGFIGFFDVRNGLGTYSASFPSVYDHFIENGGPNGSPAVRAVSSPNTLPDGSLALGNYLTSDNLYLNGTLLRRKYDIQRPRISALRPFNRAVSLYHLDTDFYEFTQTDALLKPYLKQGSAIHTPGPIVLTFFNDMEWKTTSVLHEPLVSNEETRDLVFSARVISDTTFNPATVRLFYRKGAPTARDTAMTAVPMTRVGSTDEYQFTIPAAQAQGEFWYYIAAQDATNRTFTNPGKLPAGAQALYRVLTGADNIPPVVRFSPPKNFILNTTVADSLPIYAVISDERATGIGEAYLEYQVNGTAQPNLPLRLNTGPIGGLRYDSLYVNRLTFPANSLRAGDRIRYRIVARDGSKNRNQATNPATGFHELRVVAPQAVRDRYVNTFQDAGASAADFVTYAMSVTQPTGFSDPALHSEHPYRNGNDYRYQSNYESVLLSPVRVASNPDSAVMRFDEVVLIEPGEFGSRFGMEGFHDYLIVEGSTDNGQTWRPLLDGYNALDQTDWLAAYNRNLLQTSPLGSRTSGTAGVPALYKRRTIPLLTTFRAGDQVLFRFRLYADRYSVGWGWAMDNLRIQVPPPPPVLANEPATIGRLSVYPNPVSANVVRLDVDFVRPTAEVNLSIVGPTGQVYQNKTLTAIGTRLREEIDVRQLPTGLYFLKVQTEDGALTEKVLIF